MLPPEQQDHKTIRKLTVLPKGFGCSFVVELGSSLLFYPQLKKKGALFLKNYQADVQNIASTINTEQNNYQVSLETSHGEILIELFFDKAPKHCLNFLGLVKAGFYDSLCFHRVIQNFVIQVGCPQGNGTGGPGYTVDAEFNDYPHDLGVLSMARAQDPNSAGSQFFICLAKIDYLDGNYTVFGKVCNNESLEIVKKIGSVKTGDQDKPVEEVLVTSAKVIENPKS